MPKATHQHSTSRRALLAHAALVAPASLLPAIAAAAGEEPDPHVAWAAEVDGLRSIVRAADDDSADALANRICELHGWIVDTPARTVAGLREQARVLHDLLATDESDSTYEAAGLRNMLATLEGLAGEARA
jgi:hypothetical protein